MYRQDWITMGRTGGFTRYYSLVERKVFSLIFMGYPPREYGFAPPQGLFQLRRGQMHLPSQAQLNCATFTQDPVKLGGDHARPVIGGKIWGVSTIHPGTVKSRRGSYGLLGVVGGLWYHPRTRG